MKRPPVRSVLAVCPVVKLLLNDLDKGPGLDVLGLGDEAAKDHGLALAGRRVCLELFEGMVRSAVRVTSVRWRRSSPAAAGPFLRSAGTGCASRPPSCCAGPGTKRDGGPVSSRGQLSWFCRQVRLVQDLSSHPSEGPGRRGRTCRAPGQKIDLLVHGRCLLMMMRRVSMTLQDPPSRS